MQTINANMETSVVDPDGQVGVLVESKGEDGVLDCSMPSKSASPDALNKVAKLKMKTNVLKDPTKKKSSGW